MNKLNDFCYQPNELAVVTIKDTGERLEVYPGFFVAQTRTKVELTNAGRTYLRQLYDDYAAEKVSVDEVLNNLHLIAKDFFPSEYDFVYDKFYFEFLDIRPTYPI